MTWNLNLFIVSLVKLTSLRNLFLSINSLLEDALQLLHGDFIIPEINCLNLMVLTEACW